MSLANLDLSFLTCKHVNIDYNTFKLLTHVRIIIITNSNKMSGTFSSFDNIKHKCTLILNIMTYLFHFRAEI